jgi:murein DD-endopeptidase MepM/ murein hydrolase activator NlpD
MKRLNDMLNPRLRLVISCILLILLLAGCAQPPKFCPSQPPADLSGVLAYAEDDQLEFQFPLDELGNDVRPYPAIFCTSGGSGSALKYHAAEDYHLPAGTPVYAMADGTISFSGPMGGYGWLIIIDHPQANIYSLYGHLSPSRWRLESGPVEKGELIAYLGDPDENGGSPEQPLRPHLHFGIRAGQRADYSGMGEWRWQAGWIKPCPRDLGWLQSSAIITGQDIPPGGFPEPAAGLVAKWGIELLFTSVYLIGAICVLVFAIRKNKPLVLIINGGLLVVAGWIFHGKGAKTSYVLFVMAVLLTAIGIYNAIRGSTKLSRAQS